MALIVKSKRGEGATHRFTCTEFVACQIAGALIGDSRSFYYEPMPNDMAEIVVGEEHASFVRTRVATTGFGEVVE